MHAYGSTPASLATAQLGGDKQRSRSEYCTIDSDESIEELRHGVESQAEATLEHVGHLPQVAVRRQTPIINVDGLEEGEELGEFGLFLAAHNTKTETVRRAAIKTGEHSTREDCVTSTNRNLY